MEKLPKDILIEIALDLDLKSIFGYCLSSKYINEKVCENKIFWINKLYKDFNIDHRESKLSAKKYYLEINNLLKRYNFDTLLRYGLINNRNDLVKMAIYKNASLSYFNFNDFQKIKLLDEKLIDILFNEKTKAVKNISEFLNLISYIDRDKKLQVIYYLYDFIFPKALKVLGKNNDFWVHALIKLKEFYNDAPEYFFNLYNEKIKFYEELVTK